MAQHCSVIIPHYNQVKALEKCLTALTQQTDGDEVIVIDNGSLSEQLTLLKTKFSKIVWLENTSKINPYTSRNMGIRVAKHKLLVFLDASCIPHPNWLIQAKNSISTNPITIGKFNIIPSSKKVKDLCHGILYLLPERNLSKNLGVPAGNLVVDKNLFSTIGPFLDDVPSGNDIIWTENAMTQHISIGYNEKLCVDYPGKSFSKLLVDSTKYAKGVAHHKALNFFGLLKMLLPLRVSSFKYAIIKRQIHLSSINLLKLYFLCYQIKLNYGIEFIKEKYRSHGSGQAKA